MTINKKLLRDLLEHKGANIAVIIVIAIGIMMLNGAGIAMDTLLYSKESFYEKGNFPDAYASLISVPQKVVSNLEDIDGITKAETRLIEDVKIPNTKKVIRLISQTSFSGKYILLRGNPPKPNTYEILIDNKFALANKYDIGDKIDIICFGKIKTLKISGIAFSPEYIFCVKDVSSLMPNPKEFGIAFTDFKSLQNLTGKNFFNEVIFDLREDTNFENVKNLVEKQLLPYGLIRLYPKKDQFSDIMISNEIEEQEAMMIIMPLMFLSVAVIVMGIMIKRIIEQQRGQIGILKAFGYTDFQVGIHYCSYCFILGFLGALLGGFMGVVFSQLMLDLYKDIFNMSFSNNKPTSQYFIIGIIISSLFSIISGINSSSKAIKIAPSEAMRAEAPIKGKKVSFEVLPFFDKIFNSKGKMSIRNIFRNGKRSFFIILGLSLAFSISIMPWTMLAMMNEMVFDRFKYVEKYDSKIFLSTLTKKSSAESALNNEYGINYKQSLLEVSSTLINKGIQENVEIVGIPTDSKLYTVVDDFKNIIPIKSGGIVLSQRLAEKLNVNIGDFIKIKSPYAKYKKDETQIRVIQIVTQGIGMNGYMELDYLSKILGYPPMCSSLLIDVQDDSITQNLREKYQNSDKVINIQSKDESINQVKERMNSMYFAMFIMALIASSLTFAIVYNTFVVVLMERQREMSTLMVLGMKEKDVLSIISFEQWITAIVGMIFGIPIAKLFIVTVSVQLSTDSFTIPTTMRADSVLIAIVLMIVSIISGQILASKKMSKLSIVDVLKSGE